MTQEIFQLETFAYPPFMENIYLLIHSDTKTCICIDPGDGSENLIPYLNEKGLTVRAYLITHAHCDHIGGLAHLKKVWDAPVYLHIQDLPLYEKIEAQPRWLGLPLTYEPLEPPEALLEQDETITLEPFTFDVLHTPGHSPGSVCYVFNDMVFTGDTLFAGSIGRTDLPGGSYTELLQSIQKKLLTLPEQYRIYPGHGPPSTLEQERMFNPFLNSTIPFIGQ